MSNSPYLLAYGEVGHIPGNGVWWPAGGAWHEVCAYCRSEMSDEGKFHRNSHCIYVPPEAEDSSVGICLECGVRDVPISPAEAKNHEGEQYFKPREKSPGAACLLRVATCSVCGWWYAIERADGWANGGDPLAYHGILRSFDLRSSSIPMEVLRSELPRQLEKIGYLHPNRMEDLVAEVLRGAFDCEVRSLGYTKDGGVDLLVLLSDDPVAVQVKRRQRRNATEGVEGVREFLGAALLKGHHRLLYVSTADHYSADAGAAARRAKDCGLVNSYELVDIHVLRELLSSRPAELNWMMALKQAVQRGFTMVKTPDPYEFR